MNFKLSPGDAAALTGELFHICDDLVHKADFTVPSIWYSLTIDGKGASKSVKRIPQFNIYSGTAGILLLLLRVSQQHSGKYNTFLKRAANHFSKHYHESDKSDSSFYTGQLGIIYVLGNIGKHLDHKQLIDFCRQQLGQITLTEKIDDLLSGTAGTITGMLNVLPLVENERMILDTVTQTILHLFSKGEFSADGLHWCRNLQTVRPQCGMAHGNAGIAYLFQSISHLFAVKELEHAARSVINYENALYNQDFQNWPDLRMYYHSQTQFDQIAKLYVTGKDDFFYAEKDMNAWCYGATGIGLQRIAAYRETGHPEYLVDVKRAREKILAGLKNKEQIVDHQLKYDDPFYDTDKAVSPEMVETIYPSYTLCHGIGAEIDFLLEYALLKEQEKDYQRAISLARESIEQRQRTGFHQAGFRAEGNFSDNSLLVGKAGIGYTYLRLLHPTETPSILLPIEYKTGKPTLQKIKPWPSTTKFLREVFVKRFRRTIYVADQLSPSFLEENLFNDFAVLTDRPFEKMQEKITELLKLISDESQRAALEEIARLESTKWTLDQTRKSDALLCVKDQMPVFKKDVIANWSPEQINQQIIVTDEETHLLRLQYHWPVKNRTTWQDNLAGNTKENYVALRQSAVGTTETSLNKLVFVLLNHLSKYSEPISVNDFLEDFLKKFFQGEANASMRATLLEIIRNSIFSGFIQSAKENHFYFS
ncbi:MAG: lanthionine synthetase LanC family protein [Bacteroidota bacterium]